MLIITVRLRQWRIVHNPKILQKVLFYYLFSFHSFNSIQNSIFTCSKLDWLQFANAVFIQCSCCAFAIVVFGPCILVLCLDTTCGKYVVHQLIAHSPPSSCFTNSGVFYSLVLELVCVRESLVFIAPPSPPPPTNSMWTLILMHECSRNEEKLISHVGTNDEALFTFIF